MPFDELYERYFRDVYRFSFSLTTVTIHLYDTKDHVVHIWTEENPNTFFYRTDSELLYNALAALIQEYGSLQ